MNYRNEVKRTIAGHVPENQYITMGSLGLAGESGEVADCVKKYLYHGVKFDRDKFLKELGDVRWYMEVLCIALDTDMKEIETLNVNKLRTRYPEGFSTQASVEKLDEK